MTINQRIKFIIDTKGMNKNSFGELIGVLPQTLHNIVDGRKNDPSFKVVERILSTFADINAQWLLTGNGIPFLTENAEKPTPKPTPTTTPNSEIANLAGLSPVIVTVDEQGRDNIVLVDVKAAAGYVSHRLEPTFIKELPAFKLPGGDYRNASYRGFEIEGDSMYDTLAPGDWVISRLMTGGPGEIRDGYVHVLVTQTDILVKRCVNRTKERGRIVCISDNEAYPAFELSVEDILEVWYVRKLLSGHLPARNRELKLLFTRLEAEVAELKQWRDSIEANRKLK